MQVVISELIEGTNKYSKVFYDPVQLKSLPLSVLESYTGFTIVNSPKDISKPAHLIADWFGSHGTSLYNWWHQNFENDFSVYLKYGNLESEFDIALFINFEFYSDPVIYVVPKLLHHSQYHLLALMVGSTSSGMFGEDQEIKVSTTGLSDESLAYLRLGANKRFVLKPYYGSE